MAYKTMREHEEETKKDISNLMASRPDSTALVSYLAENVEDFERYLTREQIVRVKESQ